MICKICGKSDKDIKFYDKSEYRPLCSRQCYSKQFDISLANSRQYVTVEQKQIKAKKQLDYYYANKDKYKKGEK